MNTTATTLNVSRKRHRAAHASEQGFGLLLLVVIILAGAALAAGTVVMLGDSHMSQVVPIQESRAYFEANSGMGYARKALHDGGDSALVALNNQTVTTTSGSFRLGVSPTTLGESTYTVTSTGKVAASSVSQGVHKLVAELTVPGAGGEDDPDDPDDGDPNSGDAGDMVIDMKNGDLNITNQNDITGNIRAHSVTFGNQSTVDGSVYSATSVTIGANGSGVTGSVCAGTDVTLNNQTFVNGDINAGGNVYLGSNNSEVKGDIYAGGWVQLMNGATAEGSVDALGDVTLGSSGNTSRASIQGTLHSGGKVTMGAHTDVYGDIHAKNGFEAAYNAEAHKDVYVTGGATLTDATIDGSLHASGNVVLDGAAKVKGNIFTLGTVTLKGSSANVAGSIHAGGAVTISGSQAGVTGNVHSGGTVSLTGWKSSVGGSVFAADSVSLSASESEINGSVHSGGNVSAAAWKASIGGGVVAVGSYSGDTKNVKGSITAPGGSPTAPTLTAPTAPGDPTTPATCPDIPAPTQSSFSCPGTTNKSSGWQGRIPATGSLDPGDYGTLAPGGQTDIYLKAGTYTFSAINANTTQNKLHLDLSGGDISIFVCGNVTFGDSMNLYITGAGDSDDKVDKHLSDDQKKLAKKVYMESKGSMTFNHKSTWFGTLLAWTNIDFTGEDDTEPTLFIGSYHAVDGYVKVPNQIDFEFMPSNYANANW